MFIRAKYRVGIYLFVLVSASYGWANDHVIEVLENRLYKDRQDAYELADPLRPTVESSDTLHIRDEYRVKSGLEEPRQAREIIERLNKIDLEIDQLSRDVEKTKSALLRRVKADHYARLDLRFVEASGFEIDNITVKIDGFSLHHSKNTTSFWKGGDGIPIFYGPISAGDHQIDVDVRFAKSINKDLNIPEQLFKHVNQRVKLPIKPEHPDSHYTIVIDAERRSIDLKEGQ